MYEASQIEDKLLTEISAVLRHLGVYRNYKGYSRLLYAVYLVSKDAKRLEAVVKEVYMPVAEKHNCSWSSVERCLRETIFRIWVTNYDELCEIAKIKLTKPPTPAKLLDIISSYLNLNIAQTL